MMPNGVIDRSFDPGSGSVEPLWALALQDDGKIVVSGGFQRYNGQSRERIVRLNADGTLDSSFSARLNNFANVIVPDNEGRLLVGGWFTQANRRQANRMVRLNSDGELDSTFQVRHGASKAAERPLASSSAIPGE